MMKDAYLRWAAVGLTAAIVTTGSAAAPHYLRDLDSFRVRQVEVIGTRFMPPDQVLAASGITEKSSVFDDPAPWREKLQQHALVSEAVIERHLPATIRIRVRETEPVALVPTPELRPVDARGLLLPIDLAAAPLDLPVLGQLTGTGSRAQISNATARMLLDEIVRIRELEPALASRISEIRLAPGGFELILRAPSGSRAFLATDADAPRMRQVELTLADVAARGESERIVRIDGRFQDQVVVAMLPQSSSH